MSFSELGAPPALAEALAAKGYENPTPVQAAVLGEEGRGRDLLVSSETGSGKTVAFGLAIAPQILGESDKAPRTKSPLALVVAPTRELALQVQRELGWLYQSADARVASCVGGADVRGELRALRDGPHMVAGTPGRLVDHLDRGSLDLSNLRALVLDEADEMLDMGFRDELERILSSAPKERRTLLFSATIPKEIESLAKSYQQDPVRLAATPSKQQHRDIEYRAHLISRRERDHAVINVIRHQEANGTIVFCATREGVNHLHANLVERGFAAVALSGELTQAERNRALKSLRDGRARVLVATDVAARGLDLPDVGLVIHADLPTNPETLQHRSGRTGRAGRKGVSVLLVPPEKRRQFERIAKMGHVLAKWQPVPTADEIRKLDEDRLVRDIEALPSEPAEEDVAVARRLLQSRTAEQLASLLVAQYRARRPAPEELPFTREALSTDRTPRTPRETPRRFGTTPFASSEERPAPRPRLEGAAGRLQAAGRLPPERPVRTAPTGAAGGSSWFKVNVGRGGGADPKWLIPLLCRRGAVTKADIGAIRIMADETFVEITPDAAGRFATASKKPDAQDKSIRISPAEAPMSRPTTRPTGDRPFGARAAGDRPVARPWADRTAGERPAPRPWADRAAGDRPAGERPFRVRPTTGDRPAGERPYRERPAGDRPASDRPKRPFVPRKPRGEG